MYELDSNRNGGGRNFFDEVRRPDFYISGIINWGVEQAFQNFKVRGRAKAMPPGLRGDLTSGRLGYRHPS
ncbi:hypothetical protein [Burkholderia ubonensis]|uniref:hypothetical protein n=1 Tax=Burkholderia ubonensis TaxID=101571 RepID=UPI0012BB199F|nr:hypothetical protein [Burkholderia ubonensis]